MAVTPGNPILRSDMAALATLANGKSTLKFTQNPYFIFGGVGINTRGTGYKLGEIISMGFSSAYGICSVDSAGGVIGIRVINNGQGGSGSTATSPVTVTGGSGTGCKLNFGSFNQLPTTGNYSFPDFDRTIGVVTGLYLITPGGNYTIGDTVTLPVTGFLSPLTLTVASVDANAGILTWTVVNPAYFSTNVYVPPNVNAMPVTGGTGSGAVIGGYYTMAQRPSWSAELARLENDVANAAGQVSAISGPWPISGPTNSFSADVVDLTFYYANATAGQSVSIACGGFETLGDEYISDYIAGNLTNTYTTLTFKVVIGGDKTVTLVGNLEVTTEYPGGTPTTPTISVTSDIPGSSVTLNAKTAFLADFLVSYSSQSIAPGTYSIQITATGGQFHDKFVSAASISPFQIAYTENTHSTANGIHNSLAVNKIVCPQTPSGGGFPFGLWGKRIIPPSSGSGSISKIPIQYFLDTSSLLTCLLWGSAYSGLSASCVGFFVGKTELVSSINAVVSSQMPWNYQRTKNKTGGGTFKENPMLLANGSAAGPLNSYDQSLSVETQVEPPIWVASTLFSVGFSILSSAGVYQTVVTAGTSNGSPPNFSTTVGTTTNDGTLVWKCVKNLILNDTWQPNGVWNIGDTVIDSNGSRQTVVTSWKSDHAFNTPTGGPASNAICVDSNNNLQVIMTAGTSGAFAPAWSTVLGGTTTDGSCVWQLFTINSGAIGSPTEPTWSTQLNGITVDGQAYWQMTPTQPYPLVSAVHRIANIPVSRYPFYWFSETIVALKPPVGSSEATKTIWGCGNQWQENSFTGGHDVGWQQDNQALGWWIYSVSLNRIGSTLTDGVLVAPRDSGGNLIPVAVTIGCMRSGSFVSFGTFNTGQTIQVLWPIFTSDALVYQCSERVDIQAVAISNGGNGVTVGGSTIGYPANAAFVSGISSLLGLII